MCLTNSELHAKAACKYLQAAFIFQTRKIQSSEGVSVGASVLGKASNQAWATVSTSSTPCFFKLENN